MKLPALILVISLILGTQIAVAQDSSGSSSNWTSSSQQGSPTGALNPIRTSETHTQAKGKTVDTKSLETLGPNGQYVPYQQVERESVKVDATTLRTVERTFGIGPDGARTLVQVKQEEAHDLGGGEKSLVSTILNPDANGTLQVVQRELQNSHQVGPGVQETKTTVFTPDINGGLAPAMKIDDREQKNGDGTIAFKKSTQLPDGAGHWQLAEVREGTTRQQDDQTTSSEESVLRPDSNGNMAVVERTVSKQAQAASGEESDTTDTYSVNVPGLAGDSTLQLVQRQTAVTNKSASGQQTTIDRTERLNPGTPTYGLQVTSEAIDIVRPSGGNSSQQSRTILSRAPGGEMGQVWVDFSNSDKPSTGQAPASTAAKSK